MCFDIISNSHLQTKDWLTKKKDQTKAIREREREREREDSWWETQKTQHQNISTQSINIKTHKNSLT